MNTKKLQLAFFIGLLLLVLGLTFRIFLPFLAPIALAFMTAVVVRPVDRWLVKACGGRRTLAAALSVIFVLLVVLIPLSVLIQQLTIESFQILSHLRSNDGQLEVLFAHVVSPIQSIFPSFNPDIDGFIKTVSAWFVDNVGAIFSGTASVGVGIFLWIISFFYMLRDGAQFKRALIDLSPLADAYDKQIIVRLERTVNAVVRGTLLVSLIQALLVGTGFFIFGIPNVVLWATVAALAAFLPGLGTGLVVIPAILYLFAQSSVGAAIGLAVWGLVIVGLVDNFVLPRLVSKGFSVHQVFILFSIFGGILYFGPVGALLGPLVIALLFALIEIYKLIILDDQDKKVTVI
jgi:predicted PurR-regulated permease PerM